MDQDRTDQKRDEETGHWVSDLRPGATPEAKVDKAVEDTFPASDPAHKDRAPGCGVGAVLLSGLSRSVRSPRRAG